MPAIELACQRTLTRLREPHASRRERLAVTARRRQSERFAVVAEDERLRTATELGEMEPEPRIPHERRLLPPPVVDEQLERSPRRFG
jgi:hypothetical protein